MRRIPGALALALSVVVAHGFIAAAADDPPPPWAYGFTSAPGPAATAPPPAPAAPAAPPAPDPTPRQLPGSTATFTLAEIRDGFGPADWFPGDHPAMPEIVARGKRPDVRACALCHYPNGKGRPENAGVSGLPVSYFIQTMADFKNGTRKSADARKANTNMMIAIAKGMTDEEVKIAADYFAAMPWTPWIKVVETATVPKTRIAGGMFLKLDGGETEPIGNRIIEMPEDTERTEVLRDPRSWFIAYVPGRQHQEGRGARHDRRRQDDRVRGVPRRGPEGARPGARHRGPFAELHGAAAVRHADRRAQRRVGGLDEAGGGEADQRGHARDCGVYRVA